MTDDPFLNDGCTFFPDGNWRPCCDEHDPAFLQGETLMDFVVANLELFTCILSSGGSWSWIAAFAAFVGVSSPIGWLFFKRGKWGKRNK